MKIKCSGQTKEECEENVKRLVGRGWTPLNEPKEVIEPRSIRWVVVLQMDDKK